jgi:hypothetical protein
MHTYWLRGPTQIYLRLLETTRNHAVTISDLQTGNKEEPLMLARDTVTSTSPQVPEVTLDDGDLSDPT